MSRYCLVENKISRETNKLVLHFSVCLCSHSSLHNTRQISLNRRLVRIDDYYLYYHKYRTAFNYITLRWFVMKSWFLVMSKVFRAKKKTIICRYRYYEYILRIVNLSRKKKSRPNCYPQSASTKLLRNQGSGTDTVNSYVLNDRKINYIDLKDIS